MIAAWAAIPYFNKKRHDQIDSGASKYRYPHKQVDGKQSSYRAELIAILATFVSTNLDDNLATFSDCELAIDSIHKWSDLPVNARLMTKERDVIEAIREQWDKRSALTLLCHVYAHQTDGTHISCERHAKIEAQKDLYTSTTYVQMCKGNEMADQLTDIYYLTYKEDKSGNRAIFDGSRHKLMRGIATDKILAKHLKPDGSVKSGGRNESLAAMLDPAVDPHLSLPPDGRRSRKISKPLPLSTRLEHTLPSLQSRGTTR